MKHGRIRGQWSASPIDIPQDLDYLSDTQEETEKYAIRPNAEKRQREDRPDTRKHVKRGNLPRRLPL